MWGTVYTFDHEPDVMGSKEVPMFFFRTIRRLPEMIPAFLRRRGDTFEVLDLAREIRAEFAAGAHPADTARAITALMGGHHGETFRRL